MVHSVKELLGTSYRVVEILFRPEHFVVVEIVPIEQIEGDAFEAAVPTFRISVRPSTRVIRQQSVPNRVAVMVESDYPVGHEDMVSRKAFGGDDALGIKSGEGCFLQKHSGENGTRAVSEEEAVRQSPASHRVFLYAGLQRVQGRCIPLSSLVDDHCHVNHTPSNLKLCKRFGIEVFLERVDVQQHCFTTAQPEAKQQM